MSSSSAPSARSSASSTSLAWTAPAEPDGETGYDHVPGLLTQLSREPRERPRIEVADRPLDDLEYDDVRLREYDPAPGLEFAVAE